MLKIYIQTDLKPEFDYITSVLLGDFLGVNFEIFYVDKQDYICIKNHEKELRFSNVFWKNNSLEQVVFKDENVKFLKSDFSPVGNIPVFFGESEMLVSESILDVRFDLFGCAFFMLSRLEEHLSIEKDKHERFKVENSFAFKNTIIDRPIVNEYVEFLWNLFVKIDISQERKIHTFEVVPTHDVDHILYWNAKRKKAVFKNIFNDFFIRKNPSLAFERAKIFLNYLFFKKDPNDSFEFLIQKANKIKVNAQFYFISGGETIYEKSYSIKDNSLILIFDKILKNGHKIGIHPSYNTLNDADLFKNELLTLKGILNKKIKLSRQHYLRFDISKTPLNLQENDISQDSSLGFSEIIGFRSGVCYDYALFDFINRKKMKIDCLPLLVMDNALANLKINEIEKQVLSIKEKVNKYNGKFVFLWHNNNVFSPEWIDKKECLEKLFYAK